MLIQGSIDPQESYGSNIWQVQAFQQETYQYQATCRRQDKMDDADMTAAPEGAEADNYKDAMEEE